MTADALLLVRAPEVLWRSVGPDVVLLLPDADDSILRLSGGAGAVWRALEGPVRSKELLAGLARGSGTSSEEIVTEVEDCIERLARAGALVIADADA